MKTGKMTSKEMEMALRYLEDSEAYTAKSLDRGCLDWDTQWKNWDLIKKEADMIRNTHSLFRSVIDESEGSWQAEMLRGLESNRRMVLRMMNMTIEQQERELRNQNSYMIIRQCIEKLEPDMQEYICRYYIKDLTPTEGQDVFQLSPAQFFRKAGDALKAMTDVYNTAIEEDREPQDMSEKIISLFERKHMTSPAEDGEMRHIESK